jgi:hypothetical protein
VSLLAMQILGTSSFLMPHPSRVMPAGYRATQVARPMRGLAGLRMLKEPQGSDAFARILEKDRNLSPLHKLPATPAKALKLTTIPLGAAVGFVATPMASPVLRACGALFAGVAAKVANDRVRSVRHALTAERVSQACSRKTESLVIQLLGWRALTCRPSQGRECHDVCALASYFRIGACVCPRSSSFDAKCWKFPP